MNPAKRRVQWQNSDLNPRLLEIFEILKIFSAILLSIFEINGPRSNPNVEKAIKKALIDDKSKALLCYELYLA